MNTNEHVVKEWNGLKGKTVKILNGLLEGIICNVIEVTPRDGVTLQSEELNKIFSTGVTNTIPLQSIRTYRYEVCQWTT